MAALTGLPPAGLHALVDLGAIEVAGVGGDRHACFGGTPAVSAAVHELLVALEVDPAVAAVLVRPACAVEPAEARRAAAARRLLAGDTAGDAAVGTFHAELQVLPAAHLVVVRVRVGAGERWDAASRAHAELATFVRVHEMTPCGPVAISVTDVAESEIGLEIAVPVEELVGSSGAVHPGHRAATQVAVAHHVGDPYTRVATGEALWRWLHEEGLQPTGLPIEVHFAPDRVDICWPVA